MLRPVRACRSSERVGRRSWRRTSGRSPTSYFDPGRLSDDGTVACGVTDVDGQAYIGNVQVGPPIFSEGLYECQVVMSVTLVSGQLVEFNP